MSDLIRRDEVLKIARSDGAYDYVSTAELLKISVVDAVEVVRCRDCKYSKPIGNLYECPFFDEIRGDEYCSNGERREENAVD